MKLELYDEDLRPEFKDCNPSCTLFEEFTDEAQAAIRIVGRATYWNATHDSYNAIYPPKPKAP